MTGSAADAAIILAPGHGGGTVPPAPKRQR
jgi:hypothetical protein